MPATRNLTIYMGDAYDHEITFTDADGDPINMAGTWRAQIRKRVSDAAALVAFTVDTTDAATGVLVLSLTKAETAALTDGGAWWDLEETGAGVTYLRGTVAITQDVSRT